VLSGKQPDVEEIIVKINNNEYKPKEFQMTNFQDDSLTFIIIVKTDDSLKSIQGNELYTHFDFEKQTHFAEL
jgi:hypothetical protein